jgi:hypothetical protein
MNRDISCVFFEVGTGFLKGAMVGLKFHLLQLFKVGSQSSY